MEKENAVKWIQIRVTEREREAIQKAADEYTAGNVSKLIKSIIRGLSEPCANSCASDIVKMIPNAHK